MQEIVLLGASGHGKVVADIIEHQDLGRIVGWIDTHVPVATMHYGYPVLGNEELLPNLLKQYPQLTALVTVGDNWLRHQFIERVMILAPTLNFIRAVHPRASLARGVTLGRGVVVMAGAVINSDTQIGDFAIINTGATVDHDNTVAEFAHIGPSACTGGNVRIGAFSFLGCGAQVIHGVSVAEHVIVGAGATVLRDYPPQLVLGGTPAKVIRPREIGENYL